MELLRHVALVRCVAASSMRRGISGRVKDTGVVKGDHRRRPKFDAGDIGS
jgi:hypothetical protein